MATAKQKPEESLHQNMRFYGQVQNTPIEAQKSFNNGRFSGTDINPMWRIKKLTEVFGPSGFGWWTQNVKYNFVNSEQTNEVAVFCELELVVVDPETEEESKPIYGVGGNTFVAQRRNGPQASDEAMKMAYTDALSIACKALGFSHDIYFQSDRTKYSMPAEPAAKPKAESKPEVKEESKPVLQVVEPQMSLQDVIKQIDEKIAVITASMDDQKKTKMGEWIKSKIGMVNYRKCTDIAALTSMLTELNTPKVA